MANSQLNRIRRGHELLHWQRNMGNDISIPEEQRVWRAANIGDHRKLRDGLASLTPEKRRFLEWKDTKWGRTAVAQAASKGHYQCVVALVESGANPRACDDQNNTPLHLACRGGHGDITHFLVNLQDTSQVPLLDVNVGMMTPLDVVRDQRMRRLAEAAQTKNVIGYDQCITDIEQKNTIFTGWLYEKTETMLSWITGLHEVTTWKHRFCLVLQRGDPEVLELALFSMSRGGVRPIQPRSVFLVHLRSGVVETTDTKWTDRKSLTFQLSGFVLHRDGDKDNERRQIARSKTTEFAAIDAVGLQAWKAFFQSQRDALTTAPPTVASHSYSVATALSRPEPEATQAGALGPDVAPWDFRKPSQAMASVETENQSTEEEQEVEPSTASTDSSEATDPPLAAAEAAGGECVVCLDGPQNAVCVPCGHNAVCMGCAEQLARTTHECPVCRGRIREVVQFYRV